MTRIVAMVGALALLSSCNGGDPTCTGANCPNVSGSFDLFSSEPVGSCAFQIYLPPPTLVLAQTDNGQHVTTQLIDPVNQVLVTLRGDVLAPDDTSNTGAFRMRTRVLRQGSTSDAQLRTIEVQFAGTVTRGADRNTLSGSLTFTQIDPQDGAGCVVSLAISGNSTTP